MKKERKRKNSRDLSATETPKPQGRDIGYLQHYDALTCRSTNLMIARGEGGGMRSDLFSAAGTTKQQRRGWRQGEKNQTTLSSLQGRPLYGGQSTNSPSLLPVTDERVSCFFLHSHTIKERGLDGRIDTSPFPTAVLDAQDGRQKKELSLHKPPPPSPSFETRASGGSRSITWPAGDPVCTHTGPKGPFCLIGLSK